MDIKEFEQIKQKKYGIYFVFFALLLCSIITFFIVTGNNLAISIHKRDLLFKGIIAFDIVLFIGISITYHIFQTQSIKKNVIQSFVYKANATKYFIGYTISLILFFFLFWQLRISVNWNIIQQYISAKKIFLIGVSWFTFFFIIFFVAREKWKISWDKQIFYGGMLSFLFVFLFIGYITHGKCIENILINDPNDTLMDFYNSIQYGLKPYSQKVIYPPLINVVYGFLGRFIPDKSNVLALRSTQMGVLIFGTYIIVVYGLLINLFYKIKLGTFYERIVFVIIILLSLPFLFAYDRANSIVPTLSFMILFLCYYKSEYKIVRWLSYVSLGIAAGIKISPAILGILLVREKRYREMIIALIIGIAVFMLPFILTDGNPIILMKNLQYTTSLYHGVYPVGNKMLVHGNGAYVNLGDTLNFFGRLYNANYHNLSEFLRVFILLASLIITSLCREIKEWKILGILTSIMVLYPGFSAIYCLIYLTIPLIYFLNSKPNFNLRNSIYLFLFMGIFFSGLNFKISAFKIFADDWHPLTLMTAIESNCLLLLMSMLLIDCSYSFYLVNIKKLDLKKKILMVFCVGIFLIGIYGWKVGFTHRSVNDFHPYNLEVGNASKGFKLNNGFYGEIEDNASIYLKTPVILKKGLAICYASSNKSISNKGSRLRLCINEKQLDMIEVQNEQSGMIYVSPEQLINTGILNTNVDFCLYISKVCATDDINISYIGPAESRQQINQDEFIAESTVGFKNDSQNRLWMGKDAGVLLNYKSINNHGLRIQGIVPNYWVSLYHDKQLILTIETEQGKIKEVLPLSGKFDVCIPSEKICKQREDNIKIPIFIRLGMNGTFNTDKMGIDSDEFSKSIIITNIGPDNSSSPTNFMDCSEGFIQAGNKYWLKKESRVRLATLNYRNTGIYLTYTVPNELFSINKNIEFELKAYIDDKLVVTKLIKQHNPYSDSLDGIFIPPSALTDSGETLELKLITNKTFDLKNKYFNHDHIQVSLLLNYIGYESFPDFINVKNNLDAFTLNTTFDTRENFLAIGKWGEFLLSAEKCNEQGIILKYNASPLLFEANPNKNLFFDIFINGQKIRTIPIVHSGEDEVCIDASELIPYINQQDETMILKLVSSNVYNVYNKKDMYTRNYHRIISLKILSIY